MALNMVTLTGTVPGGAGGYARFEPSGWLSDATDAELIPPRPETAVLDANGSFSIALLATDNTAPLPSGWTWQATIGVPGVPPYTFSFFLPYAGAPVIDGMATRDITDPEVAPVIPSEGMAAYLPLAGGTMLGPVTLAADPAAPLQPATKQYVDAHGGAVSSVFGRTGTVAATSGDYTVSQVTGAAPLASPAFTGTPTAPTRAALDASTKIATTAYADSAVAAETARAQAAEGLGSAGRYYLDAYSGTDDQRFASALAALLAASPAGGTIVLGPRAHTFASQWATTYTAGVAVPIRIQGAGVAFNGQWGTPGAATTATFSYSGGGAAMCDFQHIGSIEITGIQFKQANTGKPFILTTNATPDIHGCVFSGGGSGVTCVTDAIILGGTGSSIGSGDTAPYQGYQGSIRRNFFDGIRRIAVFQSFANSIEVCANTISATCGNAAYLGGCIEFASTVSADTGNQIWGNCAEMVHYPCFIRCTSNAQQNTFGPNGLFDATSGTVAYYVFLASTCAFNAVRDGMRNDTIPLILDLSGGVNNEATTFHQSQFSVYPQPIAYYSSSYPPLYMGVGAGPISMDGRGNGAQLAALNDVPSANDSGVQVNAYSCTQVTDGIIYSGSPWVVSATAAFTTTDAPRPVFYTGVAAGSPVIVRTATPSTALGWVASTAYSLGDIARPTSANGHLYQCTTAGTSGASQPTWPTGGGTVTDGTAVWTDRGTASTAALVSGPSTATNTGVTVSFGRLQTVQAYTKFQRHHIITSDGGTPSTGADAGAGSSPSGISTTGSDHSFTVNITTGTSPASGQMFHSNLAQNAGTFHMVMNAGNAAAAALMAGGYWVIVSGNSVQVNFTNAPAASTAYVFNFVGMA